MNETKRRMIARTISETTEIELRPASSEDIARLRSLGLPTDAIAFLEQFEPAEYAQIGGVRIWPIEDIVEENQDFVPGADLYPHGFIVFATTEYGDAYCFDRSRLRDESDAPVVLMSHEIDWTEFAGDQIRGMSKEIADGFEDFLDRFVANSLDQDPEQ